MAINKIIISCIAATVLMIQTNTSVSAQDVQGVPGDNFSLEGALDLFAASDSPEDFEKKINDKDQLVNNLDLNEDGDIDYIRIEDFMDGDLHAIVLQVPISETEVQDIAVIEIEKTGGTTAVLQIVGDEDIYGEAIVMEPYEEEDHSKGGPDINGKVRLVVNVWAWPSVRFIYRPAYRPWISPWRWHHYPRWWKPWRPRPVSWFYHRRVIVRPFHIATTHRVVKAHRIYAPKRRISTTVVHRHQKSITNYRTKRGISHTRSTKVVTGPNGGKAAITRSSTTAGVKRPNAKAGATHQRTTVRAKKADGTRVKQTKAQTKAAAKTRKGKAVKKTKTKKTRVKRQ